MTDLKKQAFENHASQHDTLGDTWQDMGVDEHFYAGFEAGFEAGKQDLLVDPSETLKNEDGPFVLGQRYQTLDGDWVRFVKVHNKGTMYETMEDEDGVNRYTRRDYGRCTGSHHSYPKNVIPPLSKNNDKDDAND